MKENHKILKNFVDKDLCKRMSDFIKQKVKQDKFYYDPQCTISPAMENIFFDVGIHLKPRLEKELGCTLDHTYNHCRYYRTGEILRPHKDKDQCEIALSVTLDYDDMHKPWPIYVYDNNEIIKAELDIGDVLVYKGSETLHWRNPFKGTWQTQAFIFYATDERFVDPFIGKLEDINFVTEFKVDG